MLLNPVSRAFLAGNVQPIFPQTGCDNPIICELRNDEQQKGYIKQWVEDGYKNKARYSIYQNPKSGDAIIIIALDGGENDRPFAAYVYKNPLGAKAGNFTRTQDVSNDFTPIQMVQNKKLKDLVGELANYAEAKIKNDKDRVQSFEANNGFKSSEELSHSGSRAAN